MNSSILGEAYNIISNDSQFVKFAARSSLSHSLVLVLTIVINIYFLLEKNNDTVRSIVGERISNLLVFLSDYPALRYVIAAVVVLTFMLRFFVPPIIDPSQMAYLNQEKKNVRRAVRKGMTYFFLYFRYNQAITVVGFTTFALVLIRIYRFDIDFLSNRFMVYIFVPLLLLRLLMVIVIHCLIPYTNYCLYYENLTVTKSVQRSMVLSVRHMGITLKYRMIQLFFAARVLINILVLIGIPLVAVWLLTLTNVSDTVIYALFTIVLVVSILFISYVNGIVEGFFLVYRDLIYKKVEQLSRDEG